MPPDCLIEIETLFADQSPISNLTPKKTMSSCRDLTFANGCMSLEPRIGRSIDVSVMSSNGLTSFCHTVTNWQGLDLDVFITHWRGQKTDLPSSHPRYHRAGVILIRQKVLYTFRDSSLIAYIQAGILHPFGHDQTSLVLVDRVLHDQQILCCGGQEGSIEMKITQALLRCYLFRPTSAIWIPAILRLIKQQTALQTQ